MHPKLSRLALVVGTGALVSSGGVVAYAQSTSGSSSSSPTAARHAGARPARLTDAQLTTVAQKLGVSLDALKAAMTSARPPKPADPGAGFAADLAKALGVDTAKVQAILDANRPAPPAAGTKPAKPDDTKLVAALASGLDLDTATVQAALDKVHAAHPRGKGDRGAAMDAAIAKALGKTAAEVHAAFASVRPAQPAA